MVQTTQEPSNSDKLLRCLYEKAQGYDFLNGKMPNIQTNFWEVED